MMIVPRLFLASLLNIRGEEVGMKRSFLICALCLRAFV